MEPLLLALRGRRDELFPVSRGHRLHHDVPLGLQQVLGGFFRQVVLHHDGVVQLDDAAIVTFTVEGVISAFRRSDLSLPFYAEVVGVEFFYRGFVGPEEFDFLVDLFGWFSGKVNIVILFCIETVSD